MSFRFALRPLAPNFVTAVLLGIALIFSAVAYGVSPGTEAVVFALPQDAAALANWRVHTAWSVAFEVDALTTVVLATLLKIGEASGYRISTQ